MVPASNGLTLAGFGSPIINLDGGYGINLDNNVAVTGFTMSGFTVNASPATTYALKAHDADGLTLANDVFNGGTGNKGGGVDINTTNHVTLTNVTSSGFHKNGFAYTPQYQNSDTPASGITFNNVTASNNGWTGISFYTVGNDHSTSNPSTIGGTHSIAGVTFTGTNTVSGNGAGIHIEGDSDAHEAAASTPVNTVTTDGTTLDLSHVAFSGNAPYDIINYQTAPVNAIGATFDPGAITGDAMSSVQRTVEDGKIIDQLDHAAYGLVTYYHNTGNLVINNYMCPAGTTVTRAANGVGLTVPAGCVPGAGTTFGYVHGTQTDANSPFPELGQTLTVIGTTNTSGTLTISLPATGRYLVAETDLSGNQLPATAPLGLYCTGDGDTSTTNDNQELTFVPQAGTTNCVAYDVNPLAAPTNLTPVDGTVTADPAFNDTWSPVTGALGYQYETSNSLTGTSLATPLVYFDNSATASNYDLSGSPVVRHNGGTPPATYYWHVRAVDKYGNVGPWSIINKVTVDTDSVTTNPANPIDTTDATLNGTVGAMNAGNTSFWWGTTSITGTLVAGTDPGSNEFPTSGWQHDSGLGPISAGQSFSKQVTGLSPNTPYYFVAWAQINGEWQPGSVVQFTTGNGTLPSVTTNDASGVSLTAATLNGTDGPVAADDTSFWWGTTPITGTLIAGTDPGSSSEFPATGWNHDNGLGGVAASGALTESVTGLSPATQYYFVAWVKSAGTWYPGSVKTFTTAPAAPTLETPANTTTLNTNNFTFTWNPVTSAASPITYQFQSSLDPTETNGILTNGLWTSGVLAGPSIVSTGAGNGTWNWQVRAKDANGTWSAWSPIWTVTLNASQTTSAAPVISHENLVVVSPTSVTITWTTDHAATSRVAYGTHSPGTGVMSSCSSTPGGASYSCYGYTYSTDETNTPADTNGVTSHSVTITGLTAGTTYYFLPVSQGSPESIGTELSAALGSPTATAQLVNVAPNGYASITLAGVPAVAGDTLAFATSSSPNSGILSGTAPNLIYTPNAGYAGSDSFTFTVTDQTTNTTSVPATVSINVSGDVTLSAPVANSQPAVTTGENKPVNITLTASGSNNSFSVATQPGHGTISGSGANLIYTPNAGYIGTDSFTFVANNGTASAPATISIMVLPPPTVTLTVGSNNPAKIKLNSDYSDQGATVTAPAADTNLTVLASVDGGATTTISGITISTSAAGTHTILYGATDSFGNTGTVSRTVIVSGPPVIALNGAATINLTVGGTYTEQGATATDLADGTDAVTPSGTVDTSTAGNYTITYNATDSIGNSAVPVTRTVIVSAAQSSGQNSGSTSPHPASIGGNGPISGSYGFSPFPAGQVLGASTTTLPQTTNTKPSACSVLLSSYLRYHGKNNSAQVTLLQKFLKAQGYMVTVNGVFDAETLAAVKQFQLAYEGNILTPWGVKVPTGYVFKTTLWQINEINCAAANTAFPTL